MKALLIAALFASQAAFADTHHYTDAGYELLASQVVEKITVPMATSRDGGTD